MSNVAVLAADLVAIIALVLVYYHRHRRRDMVLAYIGLNVGVLAVAVVLVGATVGVGVGLGLFGVLSIIRLRSTELSQQEVAYYFAALAIGLVCGLQPSPGWLAPALSALIVLTVAVIDLPHSNDRYETQLVTLDRVYRFRPELVARLEDLLDADVLRLVVRETDLVRDQMIVDVRYRRRTRTGAAPRPAHVDLTEPRARQTHSTISAPTSASVAVPAAASVPVPAERRSSTAPIGG
ncbi:MAG: DUF4956 domain-containing protein [Cellulomonadaceae bacterium]